MPRSLRSTPKATSSSRVRPSCLVTLLPALLAKGHPMSDDPLDTYVVQCSGGDLFAVSHDMTGAILPRASCAQGWIVRGKCRLGEHASVPARVDYYRPCSARRPMAPVLEIEELDRRRGARLVTSLAPVSLDAGV